jgi:hypothetical protein
MRSTLALIFLIGSTVVSVSAQTEGDLKKYFEGKQVTFRIAMPATKDGVNVYPERAQSLDYNEYSERLKDHGESIQRGEVATITKLRISERSIEVQFGNSQTRFNIHFARVESWMLTPATLVDALNRYVEFSSSDKSSARLAEASVSAAGYVRRGVVHLGPRTTYLKEGLKTEEVVRLLGAPSTISERKQGGRVISTYEFPRGEGRVLIAEFVGDTLITSRTETRAVGPVALLNPSVRIEQP